MAVESGKKKGVNADPSNGCCCEKNVGRMNVGLAQQWMAKLKRRGCWLVGE